MGGNFLWVKMLLPDFRAILAQGYIVLLAIFGLARLLDFLEKLG
jgi:hypothetical protein